MGYGKFTPFKGNLNQTGRMAQLYAGLCDSERGPDALYTVPLLAKLQVRIPEALLRPAKGQNGCFGQRPQCPFFRQNLKLGSSSKTAIVCLTDAAGGRVWPPRTLESPLVWEAGA